VHGSIADYRTWGYQFERLSRGYRVISYSRRYHYPNEWVGDGTEYSTGLHAEDLAALISGLGYGPAHLVGQSTGAVIAAHCAAHYPTLVRTLIVDEPDFMPWAAGVEGGTTALEAFDREVLRPAVAAMASGDIESCIRSFCDGVLGTVLTIS
jgi:pimeloyl-ACP methyl ester carboxylesterase